MTKLDELKFRKALAEFIIGMLEQKASDDPRQPEAMAFYRGQLSEIEASIEEYSEPPTEDPNPESDGKPKDIVIGLKTARLFAQPGKVGEQNG